MPFGTIPDSAFGFAGIPSEMSPDDVFDLRRIEQAAKGATGSV